MFKKILIANSDPQKPNWYIYDVDGDKLKNGRIFYSAAGVRGAGLPDGFRIDKKGNVYSAGPGGLHIFNKEGKLLGKLIVPGPTSNCSFSGDQKTLYITNNNQVLRLKLRN